MLVGLSGLTYSLGPGDERDFPQTEALRLVSAGYAVPAEARQIETATKKPTAERRTRKKPDVVSG